MTKENSKTETMEFQAEVKKILDIVIHSLYTERDIFLRELVSNAADALEKFRHQSLLEEEVFDSHVPLEITIDVDDKNHRLTIFDTGVGMTREELAANLGTIAHSGSKTFLTELTEAAKKDVNLIGQFGVGFYSAFMAAKTVTVFSRSFHKDAEGYEWSSDGTGSYSISPAPGIRRGTKIVLDLKEDAVEYADEDKIKRIIQQYSNFVSFPIKVQGETVNTVQALWSKNKNEITDEEYTEFYKFIGNAMDEPSFHLHFAADAPLAINALLFVPKDNFERLGFGRLDPGVNLYCQKVLIEQHSKNILPEWLRFVKGVVDSEDLPLNISRQALQDSTLVAKLRKIITKRFLKFLEERAKEDASGYLEFWKNFSHFFKEGATTDFSFRDDIARLLRFETSRSEPGELVSFADYVERMQAEQKEIYYINGPSRTAIESGPYIEAFRDQEFEVIYTLEPIDDFVMNHLGQFDGKKLVSIDRADLDLPAKVEDSEAENKEQGTPMEAASEESLITWMKKTLEGKVKNIIVSKRLVDSPAIIVNPDGFMTSTMERVLQASQHEKIEVTNKNLEINTRHPLIKKLADLKGENESFAASVAEQIFDNALIQAGLIIDAPAMVKRSYKILEQALFMGEKSGDEQK